MLLLIEALLRIAMYDHPRVKNTPEPHPEDGWQNLQNINHRDCETYNFGS